MYTEIITYISLQPDILTVLYQPNNIELLHQIYRNSSKDIRFELKEDADQYIEIVACDVMFKAATCQIKNDGQLEKLILDIQHREGLISSTPKRDFVSSEVLCINKWITEVLTRLALEYLK